jgi:hypothetical protein
MHGILRGLDIEDSRREIWKVHAGQAHAIVRRCFQPDRLEIEALDRRDTGDPSLGGHGLMEMQERIGVFGGTSHAGRLAGAREGSTGCPRGYANTMYER